MIFLQLTYFSSSKRNSFIGSKRALSNSKPHSQAQASDLTACSHASTSLSRTLKAVSVPVTVTVPMSIDVPIDVPIEVEEALEEEEEDDDAPLRTISSGHCVLLLPVVVPDIQKDELKTGL